MVSWNGGLKLIVISSSGYAIDTNIENTSIIIVVLTDDGYV